MNREKMSKLPEMQIGFIDTICAPIYTAFAKLFPLELKPLLDGCLSNRELWHELAHSNCNRTTITDDTQQQQPSAISDSQQQPVDAVETHTGAADSSKNK